MILKAKVTVTWLLICLLESMQSMPGPVDTKSLKHIANVSYAADSGNLQDQSALASIFSPRMDFDQWKPLTGRGDPLRNDPTYDYEPPVLERVHYWADDARLEREHYPERKSEVLMLGVSSRKPSITPHPPPPRRHPRPQPSKYEDFTYKISDHYPMTILVPPPPPPPGHQPPLYVLTENKVVPPNSQLKLPEPLPTFKTKHSTSTPEHLTLSYALQESNLVYQSSTTSQNWLHDLNQTKSIPNTVSSDYAGWGPTTPLDDSNIDNDTHNLIPHESIEVSKHPYKFYKPMLSEAPPPPPQATIVSTFLPTFVPTALPATETPYIPNITQTAQQNFKTTTETTTNTVLNYEETTEQLSPNKYQATSNHLTSDQSVIDMLGPMMSMPLGNGPERVEDNLYAHASENLHIYKEHSTVDSKTLETMQTMQPPPPIRNTESTTESQSYHTNPYIINNFIHIKPSKFTHDPYLHMRFTTPAPIVSTTNENIKSVSEVSSVPMYLIIQGHSKVKTYSSKPNINDDHDPLSNEIPNPNETTEVKHLHPIKEKKDEKTNSIRESRSKDLKSLINENIGSIEIQEADIGIKYDVSDGSDVPVEVYRRGIVESADNYSLLKKKSNEKRTKRQFDLEDLLPFDEDALEEYVYNFVNDKRNATGITGLLAQAVTSDETSLIDDDNENEPDDEER